MMSFFLIRSHSCNTSNCYYCVETHFMPQCSYTKHLWRQFSFQACSLQCFQFQKRHMVVSTMDKKTKATIITLS